MSLEIKFLLVPYHFHAFIFQEMNAHQEFMISCLAAPFLCKFLFVRL